MLASSARDAEHLDLLRAVGAQSYMVVPLRARGRLLGTMVLLSTHPARHYGEDDLAAAEELASGCALAVDNARLFTEARDAEKRKDEGLALLDGLFANAPVGLGFLDTQLRYVRINRKLAEINGRTIDDHLGQRVDAVIGGDLGAQVARDCLKVIETGEPLLDLEVTGEPVFPGRRRVWLANYYPVRMGLGGEVTGVGTVVQEITERKRVERRASFLAEASALMDQSLDTEVTLRNLGAIIVPELADWFAVDLLGSDEEIRRAAVAHADPAKTALGWELARRFPATLEDEAGFGRTIRSGCSELLPQVPDHVIDQVSGARPEYAEILRGLGLTSTMIVPLRARGRILGGMLLAAAESGRRFNASDLALAEELGVRCALALDNARLYQERSETARTLQSSLLPPGLPSIPGLELAARYRAAGEGNEVGGDFYDVFAWDEAWAVVIGDVCGKGPDAAAITALARYTLRAVTPARAHAERHPADAQRRDAAPALRRPVLHRRARAHPARGRRALPRHAQRGRAPAAAGPARRRPRRAAGPAGDAARRGRRTAPPGRRARARGRRHAAALHRRRDRGAGALVGARRGGAGVPARGLRGPGRGRDRGDDRARRGRRAGGRAARRHRAPGPQRVGRVER